MAPTLMQQQQQMWMLQQMYATQQSMYQQMQSNKIKYCMRYYLLN